MELKLLKKRCPHCNKEIKSLYQKQLNYNFQAHVLACKQKIIEQENNLNKRRRIQNENN